MVKGSRHSVIIVNKKEIKIFIPFVSSVKDVIFKTQLLIGHIKTLEAILSKKLTEQSIDISLVVDSDLNTDFIELLHLTNINYLLSFNKTRRRINSDGLNPIAILHFLRCFHYSF